MTLQFQKEHLPSYHRQIAIKLQTATAAAVKWASVKGCEGIQNMIFEQLGDWPSTMVRIIRTWVAKKKI